MTSADCTGIVPSGVFTWVAETKTTLPTPCLRFNSGVLEQMWIENLICNGQDLDLLIAALSQGNGEAVAWQCKARSANTGANDPQDCDWPVCGCDPHADKVIEALEESDRLAS